MKRSGFHLRECRQKMLALRLDKEIFESSADQAQSPLAQPATNTATRRLCSTARLIGTSPARIERAIRVSIVVLGWRRIATTSLGAARRSTKSKPASYQHQPA